MLFCVDAAPRTAGLRNHKRRGANVQLLLSFLRMRIPGTAPVWAALDDEQRAEVVSTLARLIVKTVAARNADAVSSALESHDE